MGWQRPSAGVTCSAQTGTPPAGWLWPSPRGTLCSSPGSTSGALPCVRPCPSPHTPAGPPGTVPAGIGTSGGDQPTPGPAALASGVSSRAAGAGTCFPRPVSHGEDAAPAVPACPQPGQWNPSGPAAPSPAATAGSPKRPWPPARPPSIAPLRSHRPPPLSPRPRPAPGRAPAGRSRRARNHLPLAAVAITQKLIPPSPRPGAPGAAPRWLMRPSLIRRPRPRRAPSRVSAVSARSRRTLPALTEPQSIGCYGCHSDREPALIPPPSAQHHHPLAGVAVTQAVVPPPSPQGARSRFTVGVLLRCPAPSQSGTARARPRPRRPSVRYGPGPPHSPPLPRPRGPGPAYSFFSPSAMRLSS